MNSFLVGLIVGCVLTLGFVRIAEWISILIPWRRVMMSGAGVSVFYILRMRLKGCPAPFLVDAYSALVHSGAEVDIQQVEACYLARKHEIREDDIGAFIEMVKHFVERSRSEGGG